MIALSYNSVTDLKIVTMSRIWIDKMEVDWFAT